MLLCSLALGCVLLQTITVTQPRILDFTPDEDGFLRNWLVLAPLPLAPAQRGAVGLKKAGLPQEANLTPRPGEKVQNLAWKPYPAQDSYLDFNEFLGQDTDDCIAYAVCYLWLDKEARQLQLKMGSDDQAKVYLNGVAVLQSEQPRALVKDQDAAQSITLRQGRNVLIFKVVNEKGDFTGAIRFLDKAGQPFRNYKIGLTPVRE